MCYRLERYEEAHGSFIPLESECKLAPNGSDARASLTVPQAGFGTVAGRGQSFMWSEAAACLLLLTQPEFAFVFITGNNILDLSFFRYKSYTEAPKISLYWPTTLICGALTCF